MTPTLNEWVHRQGNPDTEGLHGTNRQRGKEVHWAPLSAQDQTGL